MINLDIGSAKRLYEFISRLSDKDKIAIVTHGADLDGIASAIIVNKIIDANEVLFVNYVDLKENLADELKKKKINKIIFTDLMIKDESFVKKLETTKSVKRLITRQIIG